MKTWSVPELKTFLAAERESPNYPLWLTLITTGHAQGRGSGAALAGPGSGGPHHGHPPDPGGASDINPCYQPPRPAKGDGRWPWIRPPPRCLAGLKSAGGRRSRPRARNSAESRPGLPKRTGRAHPSRPGHRLLHQSGQEPPGCRSSACMISGTPTPPWPSPPAFIPRSSPSAWVTRTSASPSTPTPTACRSSPRRPPAGWPPWWCRPECEAKAEYTGSTRCSERGRVSQDPVIRTSRLCRGF